MIRLRIIKLWVILCLAFVLPASNATLVLANQAAASSGTTIYLPSVINGASGGITITPTPNPTAIPTGDPSLIAAGDIARCGFPGAQQTAALVQGIPGTVLALGDNAYDSGSALEYDTCYQPTWGVFKDRTKPIPGNHDYLTAGATGYFGYFGAAAGNAALGYYSFDLGNWHILAINSNCTPVGGCGINTPQDKWVLADLASTQAKCVLAFWHHPFYSSGSTGNTPQMHKIYQDLYNAGAEIVLSGHEHNYERFAPQDANAILDTARGLTQFVVGTGGGNFTPLLTPRQPNSLVGIENVYGVLHLTLKAQSYTWAFVTVDGVTLDSGTANCH